MNGKKGSITIEVINLTTNTNGVAPDQHIKKSQGCGDGEVGHLSSSSRKWVGDVWKFAKEDTNRATFALKVGFAVLLASLLVLFRAPFEVFGTNIIWSILTVAIMFEYTVGATFNRGFNRALGSLLAVLIAIVMIQVAMSCGRVAEPFVIGLSIFFIGAITSFMKLWPSLVPYEYGFRVILFTYCLIIVSGYRVGNPIRTAMDRLYSIAIGGFVAVLVNVLICPIWAGEQLHMELVSSFNSVADSLEECVNKYLSDDGSDHPEFAKTVMDEFPDEPAFKKCKATLDSAANLDSLANSAKWEPPHGRFRHFSYPWSEYVKVGAVLRRCAYEVMALHGCLHSEIQASFNLRCTFRPEILDATNHAADLIRNLGKDISNMKHTFHSNSSLLKRVHSSTLRLQRSIDIHSYLLITSLNPNIDSSYDSSPPTKPPPSATKPINTAASFKQLPDQAAAEQGAPLGLGVPVQAESYHETMKKQQRRLYSWPSREVDDEYEEDGDLIIPRMRALECTASMSLATFTSLLIELVARLDHLVDAVDVLAKLARFKEEHHTKG